MTGPEPSFIDLSPWRFAARCQCQRSPQHDTRGNLYTCNSYRYTYDWNNRLVKVEHDGGSGYETKAEYTYDALSRRVTKIDAERYVYDGARLIEEYDDTPTPTLQRRFVFGEYVDDALVVDEAGQGLRYCLKDIRFSITMVTDPSGGAKVAYKYSAFGKMKVYTYDGQNWTQQQTTSYYWGNTRGYTGRRWDKDTGLWHHR